MPLELPSLFDLDQTTVDNQRAVGTQLLQEYDPSLDLKRGVLHDYILALSAVMAAANQANTDRVLKSRSLKAIQDDPTLADDELVDHTLSNWGVTRREGAKATGEVAILLTNQVSVVVSDGTVFTISGQEFVTTATFASRLSTNDVLTDTDRLLVDAGSGTWLFTVTVEASVVGTAGNIAKGSVAETDTPPPLFSAAYANTDFTGGVDDETNEQLLARLPSGLAAKLWGGRDNIAGLIKYQFPDTSDVSVIGFGDSEMLRDHHSLWPGSTGGKCDIYVRSARAYQDVTLTKSASLLSKVGTVGTWQIILDRDDAPGFYEVVKILKTTMASTAGGFSVSSDVRSYDLTDDGEGLIPDITSATEAAYSPWQTATVQFADDVTDASGLSINSTANYLVVVRMLPDLRDIQDFLRQRERGSALCDELVKAVVPCFVSLTFTINLPPGSTAPDLPTLQQVVADTVNTLGFATRLTSSQISRPILEQVVAGAAVTGMSMTGRLRKPNGSIANLVGSESISLPSEPANLVTNRTTAFITASTAVAIAISYT